MHVAIVHYWLVGMRGGEKVLKSLCELFPDADIFTHVYNDNACGSAFHKHKIYETYVGRLPLSKRLYQAYLPLMPAALESLDLSGYDLVISSEAGPAKGVIAPPDAVHMCYVHSPMRYIWDQFHIYREEASLPARLAMDVFAPGLRQWDVTSAARVDRFAANSRHVAKRIKKYWRREAAIVHPPVFVEDFAPIPTSERGDFYLWAGELASYKRPDVAIEAFNRLGRPLKVIGGPEKTKNRLARQAGPNIEFLGKVDFPTLKQHMSACRALIFPGEEDFGIVPVEVMASGRPVIAYGRGGALDTVYDRVSGLLYDDPSVDGLVDAVERFEQEKLDQLDPQALVTHAQNFDEAHFKAGILKQLQLAGLNLDALGLNDLQSGDGQ